jgi:hypothetical protein
MTIITAAAMALLLTADPAPAPAEVAPAAAAPAPTTAAPAAAPAALQATPPAVGMTPAMGPALVASAAPATSSKMFLDRQVRAGLGVAVTNADKGFASTFQVGVQLDPWDAVGFRAGAGMTTSVVGAGGWDAAEFSGSAVLHPFGLGGRIAPYIGVGVQFAFMAVFPDDAPPPPQGLAKLGTGHLAPSLVAAEGTFPAKVDGFGGTNQFKVMPEATVGALIRLTPKLSLDAAARYQPLIWNGTTYNGLSVIAALSTPF